MAALVTLESLVQSVRRRANIESQFSFLPDSELVEYINSGLAEVYDLLVQARGQERFLASYSFSTAGNVSTYNLPGDMLSLMGVDLNLGLGIVLSARPYMFSERNRFRWFPGWNYTLPVYYRLQGQQIAFIPAPSSVYSVTLRYYPVFAPLADPADSFDGVNGWEEYAIWAAVARCKAKGDEDTSFAERRMAEIKEKIEAMAPDFAGYDAERVHDVSADFDPFGLS